MILKSLLLNEINITTLKFFLYEISIKTIVRICD